MIKRLLVTMFFITPMTHAETFCVVSRFGRNCSFFSYTQCVADAERVDGACIVEPLPEKRPLVFTPPPRRSQPTFLDVLSQSGSAVETIRRNLKRSEDEE
jgi:hypothetical protein